MIVMLSLPTGRQAQHDRSQNIQNRTLPGRYYAACIWGQEQFIAGAGPVTNTGKTMR